MTELEAFAAAIRANPHDLAGHCAFADYLAERGDPRGEFMQVQIALEDEKLKAGERKRLHAREAALLEAHEAEWVGGWPARVGTVRIQDTSQFDPCGGQKYFFERGLLTRIAVGDLTLAAARHLRAATTLGFVRDIFVARVERYTYGEEDEEEDPFTDDTTGDDLPAGVQYYQGAAVLAGWPQLRHVRRLGWGPPAVDNYAGRDCDHRSWMPGEFLNEVVANTPDIEELLVFAHVDDAKPIASRPLPNLRVFQLYHASSYPLEELAANASLGNLTHLLFHPRSLGSHDDPYIRLDGLRAVCRSPHLKSLAHLRLRLADFGNGGAAEVVASGVLKRLKTLDLRHGCITDDGARALAACPDLRRLEHLDVSHNAMTTAGVETLRATGVKLSAHAMHDHGTPEADQYGYSYLSQGDYE